MDAAAGRIHAACRIRRRMRVAGGTAKETSVEPGDRVGSDGIIYRKGLFGWRPVPDPNGRGSLRYVSMAAQPPHLAGRMGSQPQSPVERFASARGAAGDPLEGGV
jgi:hypothetical protein